MNTSQPDKKSVMMYVMCLFQTFPHSEVDAECLEFSIHSDNSSLASPSVEIRSPDGFVSNFLNNIGQRKIKVPIIYLFYTRGIFSCFRVQECWEYQLLDP